MNQWARRPDDSLEWEFCRRGESFQTEVGTMKMREKDLNALWSSLSSKADTIQGVEVFGKE